MASQMSFVTVFFFVQLNLNPFWIIDILLFLYMNWSSKFLSDYLIPNYQLPSFQYLIKQIIYFCCIGS